jgi:hypothetical protein
MRVRFQRNVRRCSAGSVTGLFQRNGLGMFYLFEEIEAFAGDLTGVIHDHCSYQRTWTNLSGALHGQLERARHHLTVCISPLCQGFLFSRNEVSTTCVSAWDQGSLCVLSP